MDKAQVIHAVNSLAESIRELDETFTTDGVSRHFLQLLCVNNEIQVNGNLEGLVHLALKILETAVSEKEGYHSYFDESAIMDECVYPLVVSYKAAEWDK